MATVLLVIHLMIAAALVGVVLLQRSEGGALGIGGGGGGFLTGRGTANLLTRLTAGLAAAFFVTSMALTLLNKHTAAPASVIGGEAPAGATDQAVPAQPGAPGTTEQAPAAPAGRGGILDKLQGGQPGIPQSK